MKRIIVLVLLTTPFGGYAQTPTGNKGIIVIGNIENSTLVVTHNYAPDTLTIQKMARKEIEEALSVVSDSLVKMRQETLILQQTIATLRESNEAVNYEQNERIGALENKLPLLATKIQAYENAFALMKQREAELEEKKYSYLPLGVYQFTHKQTGKGILFAGLEVGLLGTSIGYCLSSQCNFKKHNLNSYDRWERDRFYDRYKNQRRTAGWLLAGAAVAIGLNYCDNFNWFRKNKIQTVAIPTVDFNGNPQISVALSMNF